MPVHIVERLQKMNRAERMLWTQLGREPSLEEIAEEASLPIQQAHEVLAAARVDEPRPARGRAGGRRLRRLRRGRRAAPRGRGRGLAPQPGAVDRARLAPGPGAARARASLRAVRRRAEDARGDRAPAPAPPRAPAAPPAP